MRANLAISGEELWWLWQGHVLSLYHFIYSGPSLQNIFYLSTERVQNKKETGIV